MLNEDKSGLNKMLEISPSLIYYLTKCFKFWHFAQYLQNLLLFLPFLTLSEIIVDSFNIKRKNVLVLINTFTISHFNFFKPDYYSIKWHFF